jgi:hypothetical protein
MDNKIDLSFIKKMQQTVEPDLLPGETAIEYLKRKEAEKVEALSTRGTTTGRTNCSQPNLSNVPQEAPKPPVQEVVFIEGHKFSRDFFTYIALCIMKLDDPELNKLTEAFGFSMKDLDGKPVILKKKKKSKK